jgi:succinoglycan biosynthesis protein ExoA
LALFRQYKQYGYWKVRVIQKHKLPASWRHLVPGAFVLTLLLLSAAAGLGWMASALGLPFSALWPRCVWIVAVLSGTYCLCVLLASILTAARNEWKLLPVLPPVFACYHFGYGYGFLRGVWDFVVRRRGPGSQFVQLTRAAAPAEKRSGR